MVEIIVMIGVIGWFARTAKSKGKNGALWGFIGALSYYGPIIIFGWLIYPAMIKGAVTYDNQFGYIILGILLNLIIGIGCCLMARSILVSSEPDLSNLKTCPNCSTANNFSSAVCISCGKPLST